MEIEAQLYCECEFEIDYDQAHVMDIIDYLLQIDITLVEHRMASIWPHLLQVRYKKTQGQLYSQLNAMSRRIALWEELRFMLSAGPNCPKIVRGFKTDRSLCSRTP